MDVRVGSRIEVPSNKVDTPPRRGQVTEVVAEDPQEFRVEWDDGHESVIFPHAGALRLLDSEGEEGQR